LFSCGIGDFLYLVCALNSRSDLKNCDIQGELGHFSLATLKSLATE